ncbi:hypothetical protein SPI_03399 [Niveomyces insectorum RCEF 264]|uniref:NADAR domain-containing protein n=1 Tax=Niveomyces insectorum RCEF 264 TaxID=1081102 RepID=A0A162J778_9HYPO|nr:hypothetical protein SPI_03399 [Niveomyces insectorum RCEF 264]
MASKNQIRDGPRSESQKDLEEPIFFHKEWEDFGFLSNYTPAKFSAPDPAVMCAAWLIGAKTAESTAPFSTTAGTDVSEEALAIEFKHSEQYYMYCKAVCFGDAAAARRILAASKASDCKDAARDIRGYDETVWALNDRKLRVMADALWYKFGGAHLQQVLDDGGSWLSREARLEMLPDLGHKLLATNDWVFVEAAGRDSFWGIGYSIKQGPLRYQKNWGENNLGKSLMTMRERLRNMVEDTG